MYGVQQSKHDITVNMTKCLGLIFLIGLICDIEGQDVALGPICQLLGPIYETSCDELRKNLRK